MCKCRNLKHNRAISYTTRYFELLAFAVNGKVAEEVFYLTDMVNMLQVVLFIATMIFLSQKENRGEKKTPSQALNKTGIIDVVQRPKVF